jgi:hypothetical protein
MKALNAVFKLSILAAVLLGSLSAAHYYLVYLPDRDARLDAERRQDEHDRQERAEAQRRAEQERAEAQRRFEQEQVLSQRRALEQRQSAEKAAMQTRYKECISRAEHTYTATWASNCKDIGEKANLEVFRRRANCGTVSTKAECESWHPLQDTSPNCLLPRVIATDLSAALEKMRDRCMQESKSGLQ